MSGPDTQPDVGPQRRLGGVEQGHDEVPLVGVAGERIAQLTGIDLRPPVLVGGEHVQDGQPAVVKLGSGSARRPALPPCDGAVGLE